MATETSKIKTAATLITPTMAIKWLEGNTHNRDVSQPTVDAFARDIVMGRWVMTHQGIAFAANGTLIDGQHRLWAVVEAKKNVLMNVTTGLPLSTQDAIDTGRNRSVRDIIALRSRKDGQPLPKKIRNVHTGIARMLCEQLGIDRPTVQEQIKCFTDHAAAILAAIDMFPRIVPRIQNASVGCVVTRAILAGEKKDQLAAFVYILTEGMPESGNTITESDRLVIKLRRLLTDENPSRSDVYHKTERVLRAYLDGERMANIYAASVELFLIPGEKPLTAKKMAGLNPSERRKRGANVPYKQPEHKRRKYTDFIENRIS